VDDFDPVYSKSGSIEALDFQNYNYFCKKINMTARATPGEQVLLTPPPKTIAI
jgi:hypothetical protein